METPMCCFMVNQWSSGCVWNANLRTIGHDKGPGFRHWILVLMGGIPHGISTHPVEELIKPQRPVFVRFLLQMRHPKLTRVDHHWLSFSYQSFPLSHPALSHTLSYHIGLCICIWEPIVNASLRIRKGHVYFNIHACRTLHRDWSAIGSRLRQPCFL